MSVHRPLEKHPILFRYTKLLEGTAPNVVYKQGNVCDIVNDKGLHFYEAWIPETSLHAASSVSGGKGWGGVGGGRGGVYYYPSLQVFLQLCCFLIKK